MTKDGFEITVGVNHLGHFLLTHLLLDLLKGSAPSRIINISSDAHKMAPIEIDDFMTNIKTSNLNAYAKSKLANVMFSQELAKRLKGTNVTVNSCHPGKIMI
jgi:NAD(P)-dependent dehydrogenase (short-subunit alcohol dehydrogenase family)